VGVTLAIGSMAAAAGGNRVPDNPSGYGFNRAAEAERYSKYPTFEASERTGLALVESALSLIAGRTHVEPVFCADTWYKLSVTAFDLDGSAVIDGGAGDGGTTLDAHLTVASKGAQVDVTAAAESELNNANITNYIGDHQWSRLNNIFLDSATWTFSHPQSGRLINYDEHSIKDYYKRVIEPCVIEVPTAIASSTPSECDGFRSQMDGNESWEFDFGFEVITKGNLPVTKWTELSWYRQQDGNEGVVRVRKELLAPNHQLCRIEFNANGFAPFDEYSGKVHVYKPNQMVK